MNRRFGLVAAFAGAVWAAAAGGSFGQTHDATPGGRPGSVGGQPPAQVRAQPPADPRESAPSPEPPPAPLTSQAVPATTEPASQPTTESAEAQDPRLTPRTMMEEFLQAVGESEEKPERIQDAVGCLDLTEMARTNPKVAERRGPVIAKQLDEIIEALLNLYGKTRWEIPREPQGNRVVFPAKGEIQLVMIRADDGIWRFSPETIANIPKFRETIKQKKEAKEKASPRAETPAGVPPEFRSPRATMRTFMDAMAKVDKSAAAKCLDLSDISAASVDEAGAKLVDQLMFVMDRIAGVVYQDIPSQPDAPPYTWYVGDHGRIEIAQKDSGPRQGQYLFTKTTVKSIEPMYKAFQGKLRVRTGAGPRFWNNSRLWLMENLPSQLKRDLFGVEAWQWLGLAIVLVAGYAIHRIALLLFCRIALAMARKGLVESLPAGLAGSLRPLAALVMVATWWGGLQLLLLPTETLEYVWPALKFVATAVGVWASYRLIDIVTGLISSLVARTPTRLDDVLVPLARKTAKIVVIVAGLLFILKAMNVDQKTIQNLLAGLGIGGLAFALAAQESLKNFFGSITVVLDRPFQVGDWVKIGSVEGTVESVGLRSSRIRTFYDSEVIVPNSDLITATIDNMGRRRYRRTNCKLSVVYSTTPARLEAFCEGIRELIRRHPHTRKDNYNIWVAEFGPSSIDVLLDCFHEIPDGVSEPEERHRLFLDIIRLADRLGVEFAFPTRTVHVTGAEATPGGGSASAKPSRASISKADGSDPITWGRSVATDIALQTTRSDEQMPPLTEPSQVD